MSGSGADAAAHLVVGRARAARVHRRDAVRALVVDDDGRYLLLSEAGSPGLKFPGGGVHEAETDAAALERELREETGFALAQVQDLVVVVDERRPGIEPDVDLAMQSRYYRVLLGAAGAPALEADELALGLDAVWVRLDDAVARQRRHVAGQPQPWAERELAVLEWLAAQPDPRPTR